MGEQRTCRRGRRDAPPGFRWSRAPHQSGETNSAAQDTQGRGFLEQGSLQFFSSSSSLSFRVLAARYVRGAWSGRMARAAVVAVIAVAVLLACLPRAASSSSYRAAAALRRLETAAPMDNAQGMREKADVAKVAAEDVSTTGFGAESEREVPTGPDPIHHHGRGPRRQSP
ncbi:hypothetical protein GQ55_7G179700 [Panicum hallii var. hallii]|uniref:Uncharacterized protein n=1 Tax=Panicum hallii var. hallii TaxID=1504633 RepID=A0A2T7CW82_9POAL|nr:hypothetical protein GQ55_7G179700 [Panicum hallii var. hallii]